MQGRPYLSVTKRCLLLNSPTRVSTTTVSLWTPSRSLYPAARSVRIAPSICHQAEDQAGYQVCQEMLILSPLVTPFGSAASNPPRRRPLLLSSRMVAGG